MNAEYAISNYGSSWKILEYMSNTLEKLNAEFLLTLIVKAIYFIELMAFVIAPQ